jgi:hypothetical protein
LTRQEILAQVEEAFGSIPGFLSGAPDSILEQYWTLLGWVLSDTKILARDKVLVAFGAASAINCRY